MKIKRKEKIRDITGVTLNPTNHGKNCRGNGLHRTWYGKKIECCCDECDDLACCTAKEDICRNCTNENCPANNQRY